LVKSIEVLQEDVVQEDADEEGVDPAPHFNVVQYLVLVKNVIPL